MLAHIFYKFPLPQRLPQNMQKEVKKLSKLKTKKECINAIYLLILKKYRGARIYGGLNFYFNNNIQKMWLDKDNQHCTNLNYIVRILLVKSGHFKEQDIILGYSFIAFSPHQYLKLKIGKGNLSLDPWGWTKGWKLGQYAHGFKRRPKSL
jgi:hypothetical protein